MTKLIAAIVAGMFSVAATGVYAGEMEKDKKGSEMKKDGDMKKDDAKKKKDDKKEASPK